jgi:FtsH-binding integral membrane protein
MYKNMKVMFYSAFAFNMVMAVIFSFFVVSGFELIGVVPSIADISPQEEMFSQLFGVLVFSFGIGYLWIARDPEKNKQIIRMGIMGKTVVVLVCLANVILENVSWHLMLAAGFDGVYAVLFYLALRQLDK